jgi:hypothetical protein
MLRITVILPGAALLPEIVPIDLRSFQAFSKSKPLRFPSVRGSARLRTFVSVIVESNLKDYMWFPTEFKPL